MHQKYILNVKGVTLSRFYKKYDFASCLSPTPKTFPTFLKFLQHYPDFSAIFQRSLKEDKVADLWHTQEEFNLRKLSNVLRTVPLHYTLFCLPSQSKIATISEANSPSYCFSCMCCPSTLSPPLKEASSSVRFCPNTDYLLL